MRDEFNTQSHLLFDFYSIFKVCWESVNRQDSQNNLLWKTEHAATPQYEPSYPKRAVVCRQGGAEDARLCFINGPKALGI